MIAAMFRIAWRAHRTGMVWSAAIGFLSTSVQASAFVTAAGHTAEGHAAFGRAIEALAPQLAYLIPMPVHPETIGGYVQWRGYGGLSLIFGFWALMAATGAIRNEEERGLLETWLAAGISRRGLIFVRCVAFAAAAAVVVAIPAAGALAGSAAAGEPIAVSGVAAVSVALYGLTVACFGIALLGAQLAGSRRAAAALGGVVLLALFLLDGMARINPSVGAWGRLSPFYLRNATTAMAPGGAFDVPATIALFAVAAAFMGLSAVAFRARDLGAPLVRFAAGERRAVYTPSENPLLRLPVLRVLYEQWPGLVAWVSGAFLLAAFLTSLSSSMRDLLNGAPGFQGYYRAAHTNDPALVLLGIFWFGIACFLVALYAITQLALWASEDTEGRLEMTLAQPVTRSRVVVERAVTLAVAVSLMAASGALALAIVAPGQSIQLDGGRLLLATALLVPLALSFGALGAAVIARAPRLAVGVLSGIALIAFFILEIGPLFSWPDWAMNLSLFKLYGTPMTTGLFTAGLWIMLAIVVVGFGSALVVMQNREVGA